ncbi:VOC family protein [Natronosporangium hydrolyticum]|nr:VOC family protein [Natronosporangium hydrolyticum]
MPSPTASAKLSMFGIVADDLPKTLAFYRRLGLDIPPEADQAPHVEVTLPGGLRLAWDPAETVRSFDSQWQPPAGGSHRFALAFEYDGPAAVDAAYDDLVSAGYEGHLPPWNAPWGQRYATVKDPDGNAVDLFSAL